MTKTRMASEIQGLCSKGQFQSLASLQQVSSKDTEGRDFLLVYYTVMEVLSM